jgi:hypothetical protein
MHKVLGELSYIADAVDFDMNAMEESARIEALRMSSFSVHELPEDIDTIECRVPGITIPTHLTRLQRYSLIKLINEYEPIFAKDKMDLGRTSMFEYHLDTGDAPPIRQRVRPLSPAQEAVAKEEVDRMKRMNVVRDSTSPWL